MYLFSNAVYIDIHFSHQSLSLCWCLLQIEMFSCEEYKCESKILINYPEKIFHFIVTVTVFIEITFMKFLCQSFFVITSCKGKVHRTNYKNDSRHNYIMLSDWLMLS